MALRPHCTPYRLQRPTFYPLRATGSDASDPGQESVRKIYEPNSRKRIYYGIFQKPVEVPPGGDGNPQSYEEFLEASEASHKELREKAVRDLVVIDQAERDRRMLLGSIGLGVALAVDVALVINKAGFFPRLLSYFPLAFGLSFFAAGKAGMCQLAAGGMWDVDGTGFREIEDQEVASKMKEKYRNFSIVLPVVAVSLTLAFAAIPLE